MPRFAALTALEASLLSGPTGAEFVAIILPSIATETPACSIGAKPGCGLFQRIQDFTDVLRLNVDDELIIGQMPQPGPEVDRNQGRGVTIPARSLHQHTTI
jgi:hypothetical protein